MNDDDPYSRFQSLRTVLMVSSLMLTFGVVRYFKDRFPSSREELIEYAIVFVYVSIPCIIWAIVVYLVLPSLLGMSWFRRQVLRRRYIEGYWFEWNQQSDGSGRLSVMTIQPSKSEEYFVISGEHHDEKGAMDKQFRCFPYSFSWPELKYVYTARQTSQSSDVEGSGEFVFKAVDGAPQEFGGSYAHGRVAGYAVVRGRRLRSKEVAEYRRADLRDNLIRTVAAEFGGKSL